MAIIDLLLRCLVLIFFVILVFSLLLVQPLGKTLVRLSCWAIACKNTPGLSWTCLSAKAAGCNAIEVNSLFWARRWQIVFCTADDIALNGIHESTQIMWTSSICQSVRMLNQKWVPGRLREEDSASKLQGTRNSR